MGKIRRSTLLGLTILLLSVAGCKVSCTTANISSLAFSKDKEGKTQTKEFAPTDTIYAKVTVSNNPSNVTVKFRLVAEKVEGVKDNTPIPGLEGSYDLPSSGYVDVTLTPPSAGWPAGRYRLDTSMIYSGEEKDKKSDTFTVKGGGIATPRPAAPQTNPQGDNTPAEEDEDNSENSNAHGEH